MADYKVNTAQLAVCAGDIRSVRTQMNSVAVLLSGLQLGSVLRIKASTALLGRVTDCKWAVINQADNLSDLANAMDAIAQIYERCEKNLMDPKTQAQADAQAAAEAERVRQSWLDDAAEGAWNFSGWAIGLLGEGCPAMRIVSMLFNFADGDGEGVAKGFQDLLNGFGEVVGAVGDVNNGGVSANWVDNLFGLNTRNANGWGNAWDDFLDSMNLSNKTTTAGKISSACKWAGYAMSFVVSGVENYEEFGGDMGARFWGETVTEGIVDIGLGIAAGVAAAAILPASAPAIVVGAAAAGVVWLADEVLNVDEIAADFVCDVAEGAVEVVQNVGETIADGVESAWNSARDWVSGWF